MVNLCHQVYTMASKGGWFGSFKTDLADEFDGDSVDKMVVYFSLRPRKMDQVKRANNKGLELLSVLEDSGKIGEEKGIDELCEALKLCDLNKLSHKATELFNHPSIKDMPDGPVGTTLTLHDVEERLSEEMTVQDCYEIAIFLGLQARYVQEIKISQNSVVALIDKINDGKDNSDSTINALLFALQTRGMIRVAKLILHSKDILHACTCGDNSYKELKSHSDESSVVSLVCKSCAAEWFPTTESATEASLVWKNNKFSYKIPRQLDLSELKHEDVKDVNELKCGDHIVFRRAVIYDQHAIFLHISEKEKGNINVIHWTGSPVLIKCEDVWFPKGGVRRVQYPKSDPADVVVARAYDMLFNSSQEYNLVKNYCESLATFCKVGKAFSIQGEAVGDLLAYFPKLIKKITK